MRKLFKFITWARIKKLISIYILYAVILGALIFLKDYKASSFTEQINVEKYYADDIGTNDRAAIIEDRNFALTTRFRLLDEAEESVKILNYGTYEGEVCDLFIGKIIQTANRGVKVQIVFDGFVNNLRGPLNQKKWALVNNPNVEIRFYEKLNILKPWTIHNRLHDKIWIVDNQFALSGGRNIDDRFYLDKDKIKRSVVNDRDVLVWNRTNSSENTSIEDFNRYFDEIWTSKYTKICNSKFEDKLGKDKRKELLSKVETLESNNEVSWKKPINWMEISYPTDKISLVTNPVTRFKKTPIVLGTIAKFFENAEDMIIIQTPYAIYNKELQQFIKSEEVKGDVHLLTNSIYSSPNPLALSGTEKYRNDLISLSKQIYRYQGDGSIHAKSYIFDDHISFIGSFNLDPRSAFLSTENMVIIDGEEFNKALYNNILNTMEKSSLDLDEESLTEENEKPKEISKKKDTLFSIIKFLFYPFDELM